MKRLTITLVIFAAVLSAAVPGLRTAAPAAAQQSGVVWSAEFYDNLYLLGQPVLTRQLTGLSQNWGLGSPGPNVPANNWSARFASDPYFNGGTYRFYILADDAVKLWIDFPPDKRPTLDTFSNPQPGQIVTADVTLSPGQHHIQVDFRENTEQAYLYVDWESLADGVQGPNFPQPITTTAQWTATYYNNINLAGVPVLTQTEPNPTHYWGYDSPGPNVPADYFSARWIVYQQFNAGTYNMQVRADDGVRVYVDGQLLIDQWHGATNETYTQSFQLTAGNHSIVVEYYEATLIASIEFSLEQTNVQPPQPQPQPTSIPTQGAYATVTAWLLNVRDAPNATTAQIVTKVRRGESFPVVGRSADSSWWQIQVGGIVGWVSGRYVTVQGQSLPPAPPPRPTLPPTPQPTPVPYTSQCPGFLPSRLQPGDYGRVTPGLANNIRSQPSSSSALIGEIPAGGIFYVINGPACTGGTAWYQVSYRGITGWTPEGDRGVYWLEPYWSPR